MEINNLHLHGKTITNSWLEMDNSRLTFKTHLHYHVVEKKTFLNSAKYYLTVIVFIINNNQYIRKGGIRLKIQHSLKTHSSGNNRIVYKNSIFGEYRMTDGDFRSTKSFGTLLNFRMLFQIFLFIKSNQIKSNSYLEQFFERCGIANIRTNSDHSIHCFSDRLLING